MADDQLAQHSPDVEPQTLADPEHEATQDRQQDLEGQGLYYVARKLTKAPGGWDDPDVQDLRRVTHALNEGRYTFDDLAPKAEPEPAPAPSGRLFGVWNGVNLNGSLDAIFDRVLALVPPGDWRVEWFPKAGEGGSWQSDIGDPRGLSGEAMLTDWLARGLARGRPIHVAPYVVIRGRPEWNAPEWAQIATCARVAGKVVLNLEPPGGSRYYWNGPTSPSYIQSYCDGMRAELVRQGAGDAEVSVCYIPRWTQVNELGGAPALRQWMRNVTMASGECYEDAPAPSLSPGYAIPNVMQQLSDDPRKWIPTVQRSMIGRYADSAWAAQGVEVWHLDGN